MLLYLSLLVALVTPDDSLDARTPLRGLTPTQWRVVWTNAPSQRASILFTTAMPGLGSTVYYDTSPREELDNYAHVTTCVGETQYTLGKDDKGTAPWRHIARLTELAPNTTYYFRMVAGDGTATDGISRELHFRTAPSDDQPVAMLSGGDSRTGIKDRRRMNRMIAALAEDDEVLCFVHGGDYVTDGNLWKLWRGWLSDHELTTTPSGRVLPIVPTRGNHDVGPLFREVFDAPGTDAGIWFETRVTPKITLLTLDTNVSVGGPQLNWLSERLKVTRERSRWLLCGYHRPIFPAVKAPGLAHAFWKPLFESYDVDLALESDGHCAKRTVPIRANRNDPTGVTYIGEGGLGVRQRTPRTKRWFLVPEATARIHHLHRLDFGESELRIRVVTLQGGQAAPNGEANAASASIRGFQVFDDHRLRVRPGR